MNIDAFEKREQALELRAKIMQAEEERLNGAKTRSISKVRYVYHIADTQTEYTKLFL